MDINSSYVSISYTNQGSSYRSNELPWLVYILRKDFSFFYGP